MRKHKWLKATSIALSCAMLATTAPMNVLATEVSEMTEVQSVTVPVLLDLESDILSYGKYGIWKENVPLSIEVNGVRTELKKDGSSVNVDFKNGDTVKLIVSDDIELYSGTVTVEDSSVSVRAKENSLDFARMYYYIEYDSKLNNLVISGEYSSFGWGGGFWGYAQFSYDLTAMTSEGTPIQGVTVTDNTTRINMDNDYWYYSSNKEWGNGNFFSYEVVNDEAINATLIKATDETGYTDATMPYIDGISNMGGNISYGIVGDICSSGTVYLNNGLVEIDTEDGRYAILESLGDVSLKDSPYSDENGILGEYYREGSLEFPSYGVNEESLILKDESGNKIATVQIKNISLCKNVNDSYYLYGKNGIEESAFNYDVNIQMEKGMNNWKVTVEFDYDTANTYDAMFNIKAVKTVSTDTKPDDSENDSDNEVTHKNYMDIQFSNPVDTVKIAEDDYKAIWKYFGADRFDFEETPIINKESGIYVDMEKSTILGGMGDGDTALNRVHTVLLYGVNFARDKEKLVINHEVLSGMRYSYANANYENVGLEKYDWTGNDFYTGNQNIGWNKDNWNNHQTLGQTIANNIANNVMSEFDMYVVIYEHLTEDGTARWAGKEFIMEGTESVLKFVDETEEVQNPFSDVSESQYYYNPVLWAVENNITTGLNATTFAPEQSCTRGQVVTFLWRAMGCPEPTTTQNPFVDVPVNEYYTKAVLWALENGITSGYDETHFAPDVTVTRSQFVTFLYRAEGKPSYKVANPFNDVKKEYYYDAILWAYENGVTTGLNETTFGTEEACTRGQVVTFLYRGLNEK